MARECRTDESWPRWLFIAAASGTTINFGMKAAAIFETPPKPSAGIVAAGDGAAAVAFAVVAVAWAIPDERLRLRLLIAGACVAMLKPATGIYIAASDPDRFDGNARIVMAVCFFAIAALAIFAGIVWRKGRRQRENRRGTEDHPEG